MFEQNIKDWFRMLKEQAKVFHGQPGPGPGTPAACFNMAVGCFFSNVVTLCLLRWHCTEFDANNLLKHKGKRHAKIRPKQRVSSLQNTQTHTQLNVLSPAARLTGLLCIFEERKKNAQMQVG